MFYHKPTGLVMGSPNNALFDNDLLGEENNLENRLQRFVLSASGWRKVFAIDGSEESVTEEVHNTDKLLVAHMAEVFARFLKQKCGKETPVIVLGCDTRYTGPVIAEVMIRAFLSLDCTLRYLFITAAPEIMAYTKTSSEIDGFAYISASHNPIGYNGVKFGLADGGVIGGEDAALLINRYKASVRDKELSSAIISRIQEVPPEQVEKVFAESVQWKHDALARYNAFSREVVSGLTDPEEQRRFFADVKQKTTEHPIGVLAEMNGSARTLSIDREFLQEAGITVSVINSKPREITHDILPEGASLTLCKKELEALYRTDRRYLFGYVPDNDGDRGNIVFIDQTTGKAKALEAQEVFALCCLSELAGLVYNGTLSYSEDGTPNRRTAVVANGPTSLRVDRIAEAFKAEIHRAEVGEANAVCRAAELRSEGTLVRILGEGSNGGNITHPATVRDPLNSLFAFIKLLTIRDEPDRKGLFHVWCELSSQPEKYTPAYTLTEIVRSLPSFSTTAVSEKRAKLVIKTPDYVQLKRDYERIFRDEYHKLHNELKTNLGIYSREFVHYLGTRELRGPLEEAEQLLSRETGDQKVVSERFRRGGLKVLFRDRDGNPCGFIWMRGSGTEPVFRILADIESEDRNKEAWLLEWHTDMIRRAEASADSM